MQLGCSTMLFGGVSLEQALLSTRELGFEAIELCSIPGMAEHFFLDQPDEYYDNLRATLAEAGLVLDSVGASTALVDPTGRERFKKAIEAAAKIGAPFITSAGGGTLGDEASFAAIVAAANEVAKVAAQHRIKVSMKPHVGNAVYNATSALRFLAEVDTDWIGINFDPTHVYREGDNPVESILRLKDHIFTARIRDTGARPGERPIGPVEQQIPGKGTMDVAAIAEAYKQVPGLEIVTVEMVGAHDMPLDEVVRVCRETKEFLDRCF